MSGTFETSLPIESNFADECDANGVITLPDNTKLGSISASPNTNRIILSIGTAAGGALTNPNAMVQYFIR